MLNPENREALEGIQNKLENAISEITSKSESKEVFVKLSTRSPKDSFLLPHRARAFHRSGIHIDTAEQLAMRVNNGKETLSLFLLSHRIQQDLDSHLVQKSALQDTTSPSGTGGSLYICIREWIEVEASTELRCFLCAGQLTAVSQYHLDRFSRWRENPQSAIDAARS